MRLRHRALLLLGVTTAVATPAVVAYAFYADTTDCAGNFKTFYEPTEPVCAIGEIDITPPGQFFPQAQVYVIPKGADPNDSSKWAYTTTVQGLLGGGGFADEVMWPSAAPGEWELVFDQYPFIQGGGSFDPAKDYRDIHFQVNGGAGGAGGGGGAGGSGGAAGMGGSFPASCSGNWDGQLCNGTKPPKGNAVTPGGFAEEQTPLDVEIMGCGKIKLAYSYAVAPTEGTECPCESASSLMISGKEDFEVCGRTSSVSFAGKGSTRQCLTPECNGGAWTCVGPTCDVSAFEASASGGVKWSWPVEAIFPAAAPILRPLSMSGALAVNVGGTVAVGGSVTSSLATGQSAEGCGCCLNGGVKDSVDVSLKVGAGLFIEASTNLWILSGMVTLEGKVCGSGTYTRSVGCNMPPQNKLAGQGYLGASIATQVCAGGGWLKYCYTPPPVPLVELPNKDAASACP